MLVWKRGCGQTADVGVYANQRLNLAEEGKAHNGHAKGSNRTREIWPSGIIGGGGKRGHGGTVHPPRNRKSELCNLPPKVGAPDLYPNKLPSLKPIDEAIYKDGERVTGP